MSRIERVASEIQKEISKIIQFELNDPRLGFITIVHVEMSKDLEHAKVFYSVLGSNESIKNSQLGLESARGYIRKLIGDRIKLRFVPEIIFKLDKSSEYSIYIVNKIDKLKKKET